MARELEPRLEAYVDQKYKDHLKSEGQADQLANVDLISALDMYVEQGNWIRAIDQAAQHGAELQHKYIALYAADLIKEEKPIEALRHGHNFMDD